jgi:uncharacterized protein (TIGR02118 family)
MIKVSVIYPNSENHNFDVKYYLENHIPMVKKNLGDSCKKVEVDIGFDEQSPYIAMAHLIYESLDAFQKSFGPYEDIIMNDIPNYTQIQPIVQISEIKM